MGAPPGYVGYEEGGQLTEKVRRHPYCVVLFDEIEKAHPDMFNSLLQVMEEGRMTDGLGRTVDFKNCIIIMTSNVGATSMSNESMGFGKKSPVDNHENMERKITEEIKSVFRPEFINRIDEIVIFKKLSKEDMIEIVWMEIEKIKTRLTEKEISISLSKEASQFICDKGFSEEFGARPLRRYIEKNVEVVIGDMILSGEVSPGSVVSISLKEDHLDVSVSKKSKKLTKNTKIAKNMLDLKGGTSTI
jgi:ATP-dependent Clp protease ATP-binding subunit ClpC